MCRHSLASWPWPLCRPSPATWSGPGKGLNAPTSIKICVRVKIIVVLDLSEITHFYPWKCLYFNKLSMIVILDLPFSLFEVYSFLNKLYYYFHCIFSSCLNSSLRGSKGWSRQLHWRLCAAEVVTMVTIGLISGHGFGLACIELQESEFCLYTRRKSVKSRLGQSPTWQAAWISWFKLFAFFFFFCSPGAWTQGLHLEPFHQPCFLR
jgi:hypothetical protein